MKKILLILAALISNVCYSQVNIESFRDSAKKSGFFGESKINVHFQRGNVNSQIYEIKKDLHYKINIHHILLKGSLNKAFQDKELYKSSAFSHFRYTIMLHEYLGYEIFTQTQYDKFRDLSLRQLNGGGLRIEKEIKSKYKFNISSGIGVMADHEQLSYMTTTKARITSYFTLIKNFNADNSSFISIVTYYQPLLFDYTDYRINSEINLRSSIVNQKLFKIGLNTSLNYLYDTVPAEKVKNTDIILKTGLAVSW